MKYFNASSLFFCDLIDLMSQAYRATKMSRLSFRRVNVSFMSVPTLRETLDGECQCSLHFLRNLLAH